MGVEEVITDAAAARRRLCRLMKELAVVRGKVVLSSGAKADYYIDLRRVTLHHEGNGLTGLLMLEMVDNAGFSGVGAVGGLTMGADPVGVAMMNAAARQGRPLDSFVVRKTQKSYGMGRRVEGPDVAGRRVIALEDTSTTGGSVLTAVDALREAGAKVEAVAVIVDRDTGAREKVEAEAGVPYLSLFSKEELGLS